MRLFIAVKFSEELKKELIRQINSLKEQSEHGNFTKAENLHLTLAFIGESMRINDIKKIMDGISEECFNICLNGSGRFGSLYWIGLKKEPGLFRLAKYLREELDKNGIPVDKKQFSPHITIAREVTVKTAVDLQVKHTEMHVEKISLMRSDRINGKLVYTEVYAKNL